MHSLCFQHGTCFIWSSSHHTMQYTTNSTQTSVQTLILQFSRQPHSGQHSRMLRKSRRWRGRLPDGTPRWWTLGFWRNTWKTLCIHEHGLTQGLCPYPCSYANYPMPSYMDSLDLSDISDYENFMVTSNDEDIPGMEEIPYKYKTLVWLNIIYLLTLAWSIPWWTLP